MQCVREQAVDAARIVADLDHVLIQATEHADHTATALRERLEQTDGAIAASERVHTESTAGLDQLHRLLTDVEAQRDAIRAATDDARVTAERATADVDRLLSQATEHADHTATELRHRLEQTDVSVTHVREHAETSYAASIDTVQQTADQTATQILAARHHVDEQLDQLHRLLTDAEAQRDAIRAVTDDARAAAERATADVDRLLTQATEHADHTATELRHRLEQTDVSVTQVREHAETSYAASIDTVQQTADQTATQILAARHHVDEQLDQLHRLLTDAEAQRDAIRAATDDARAAAERATADVDRLLTQATEHADHTATELRHRLEQTDGAIAASERVQAESTAGLDQLHEILTDVETRRDAIRDATDDARAAAERVTADLDRVLTQATEHADRSATVLRDRLEQTDTELTHAREHAEASCAASISTVQQTADHTATQILAARQQAGEQVDQLHQLVADADESTTELRHRLEQTDGAIAASERVHAESTAGLDQLHEILTDVETRRDAIDVAIEEVLAGVQHIAESRVTRLDEEVDVLVREASVRVADLVARLEEDAAIFHSRRDEADALLAELGREVAPIEAHSNGDLADAVAAPAQVALPVGESAFATVGTLPAWRSEDEPRDDDILSAGDHPNDDFFGRIAAELAGADGPETIGVADQVGAAPEEQGSAVPTAAPALAGEPVSGSTTLTAVLDDLDSGVRVVARGADERLVRLELVTTEAQDTRHDWLRMTMYDPAGWWESQDVAVAADRPLAQPVVVDVRELREAFADLRRFEDRSDAQVVLDGDVTIGNHLLLSRDLAEVPALSNQRTVIESIELHDADRRGVVLESQVGRLFATPELVGCLRRRRVTTVELVTVDGVPHVSARIADRPGISATLVARLHELGTDGAPPVEERRTMPGNEVRQLVTALSVDTTPEELSRILKIGVGYVRRRAAAHPALSKELIHELVKDGTEAMRAAAASNVSIGTRASELAVTDASPLVRAVIAANPAIPEPKLQRLVDDPEVQVRVHAASNPSCTPEFLSRLAEDPDSSVRAAVARHEHSEVDLLVRLARDPDPAVCGAVAENPRCPTEVLDDLVGIAADAVLENPQAATTLLVAGSVVDEPRLRASVARNPKTPPKRLKRLADDTDAEVLQAIAEHPQAPKSARRRARQRLGQNDAGRPD